MPGIGTDSTIELDGTDATLRELPSPGGLDPAFDTLEPLFEPGAVDPGAVEGGFDVAELLADAADEDGSGGAGAGFEGTGAGLRSPLPVVSLDPALGFPDIGVGATVTVNVPTTTVVDGFSP